MYLIFRSVENHGGGLRRHIIVKGWLETAELTLAKEKTEVVYITKRRKRNYACIRISYHIIIIKSAI